jgi:hypothetical protein
LFGWHHGDAVARPKGSGSGRRETNLPTEEENKAIFKRYVEEVVNQGKLRHLLRHPDEHLCPER